jgi:hypothetical protein
VTPDDIKRLYDRETPATAAEAEATRNELRNDPDTARVAFEVSLTLASDDPAFRVLVIAALNAGLVAFIRERMQTDDDFARLIGEHLARALTPIPRTPRGRPRGSPNKMA